MINKINKIVLFPIGFILILAEPIQIVIIGLVILSITFILDDGSMYYK